MADFGEQLIKWYEVNKRNLPWRNTRDPYKIWLSEIILQQTRVEQGLNYYLKFVDHYPDVQKLALARQDDIYKLWQGLGYYNRANNMMIAAKTIVNEFDSNLPADYHALQKIRGIGSYTAAAIASIAFGISKPVVDGNVFRVLSRIYAITTPINTTTGKKEFEHLASILMSDHKPGTFNQALMEFGALFCKPKNPDCPQCIFNDRCLAWQNKSVTQYPVKNKKKAVRKRYFYYFVVKSVENNESFLLLQKRGEKDIWKNLYEFPSVEFSKKLDVDVALTQFKAKNLIKLDNYQINNISNSYTHQLTHQQINAVFINLIVNKIEKIEAENSILLVNQNEITNYPVSRLIEKYMQDQKMI